MKIRRGFVTNSSSTSFIISLKKEWGKENFLKTIGAEGNAPMQELFEKLFRSVDNSIIEINEYIKSRSGDTSVKDFLEDNGFDYETVKKVESLLDQGRKVYYGQLRSDNSYEESFFCCENFLLCEDEIYFNGRHCIW